MATARFIRQVGFTGDRDSENELGKLQMATFTRTARDAEGEQNIEGLRRLIRDRINMMLRKGRVVNVWPEEWIVQ